MLFSSDDVKNRKKSFSAFRASTMDVINFSVKILIVLALVCHSITSQIDPFKLENKIVYFYDNFK